MPSHLHLIKYIIYLLILFINIFLRGTYQRPSPPVYQYLWRDFSLTPGRSWILTLSGNEAIAFIGAVTIAIGYVQERMWNVLRDLFNFLSSKRHTRLSDPTVDEKRASLSQPEAIRLLLAALRTRENNPASEI
jgi:hypothetical protein